MSDKSEAKEKPLDKMTVKELREIAAEIPEITGVHGMKKDELLGAIKKVRGIEEEKPRKDKKPKKTAGVEEMGVKKKIQYFKTKRMDALAAGDKKESKILRRRINRLKKRSRRAA
jgi:hypothetical protein